MSSENIKPDVLALDRTGTLSVSEGSSSSCISMDHVIRIETNDQTNKVQLRVRKPTVSVNISNLLEKVAKGGQYDAPIGQLSARRNALTSASLRNNGADHSVGSIEIKRKPDFQGHRKIQKLFRQKQRREESTPLRPIESNSKQKILELSLHHWHLDVLRSSGIHGMKRLRRLVWGGIPSSIRGEIWSLLVGDALNIDRTLYEHCLQLGHKHLHHSQRVRMVEERLLNDFENFVLDFDIPTDENLQPDCAMCSLLVTNVNSAPMRQELCLFGPYHAVSSARKLGTLLETEDTPRHNIDRSVCLRFVKQDIYHTFRALRLFQPGCPFHAKLHDLLAAYVVYRPQIGYLPGMSHLAAVLLLVVPDAFDAFVLFANLMDKPCHRAFYSPDESEFVVYFRAFSQLLADRLPRLHAHFTQLGLEPNMYLFDWLFNMFSRVLPLEAALRVWDLYCAEGDLILFRVAAALLMYHETRLLQYGFDQLVTFLTSPMSSDMTGDKLVKQVHLFRLKRKSWTRYLKRSLSGSCPRSAQRKPFNIVSVSSPIIHSSGSKRPINRHESSVERFSKVEHFESSKSVNQASLELEFKLPVARDIRPGLVDHTIFSLLSPTPSSSLLSVDEELSAADRPVTGPAFVSSMLGHADEMNALESAPWSASVTLSPFQFGTFKFDETPISAPPDSLTKRHKLSRWASDWTLGTNVSLSSLSYAGRQAASIHKMGTPVAYSPRPQLTPSLARSTSTVFFPPSRETEKYQGSRKVTRFRCLQPELIP